MTDRHTTGPEPTIQHLSRRAFVAASAGGLAALAGCLGGDDGGSDDSLSANHDDEPFESVPFVETPPDAVYLPTHRESFAVNPVVEAGDYALLPHFTYPHRFWLVDGTTTEEVLPTVDDGAHLMIAFWDRETGQLLPVDAGATMEIRFEGDHVETVAPWPMVAQSMGFHFGDNVPLPEDGTYTVEVTMNPIEEVRKTGGFEGRFEETRTATFDFEWSDQRRRELRDGVEFLDRDQWGEPGALEPMGHDNHGDDHDNGEHDGHGHGEVPSPSLPPAEEYPGVGLGVHESGDARFVVRYFEEFRLVPDDEGYLFVSPRTPYNRIPLPDVSLSVTVAGEELTLAQTLDDDLGLHYGTAIDLGDVTQFDIVVGSPPQIARHQGYETAFLDMPPMTVEAGTVEAGE